MKFKRFSYGTLGLLAAGGIAWGCSDKASDCNANKNCAAYDGGATSVNTAGTGGSAASGGKGSGGASAGGEAGAAGDSSSAGTGGSMPTCNPSANPDSEPCVVASGLALFVSTSGNDKGDGTREKPFATVSKALAVAGTGELKRVYVCADDYNEPDTLAIPNRVELYGGFNCGDWSYSSKQKAHVISANPVAVSIANAQQAVTVQDVRFDAHDADDGMGASSFGMIVNASAGVVLRRVEINAGKGGTGQAGSSGDAGKDGTSSVAVQNGAAGNCTPPVAGSQPGGVPSTKTCESEGGDGGRGYNQAGYLSQQDGSPGLSVMPTNGGMGANTSAQSGDDGKKGADSPIGDKGTLALDIGTFAVMGYTVASGGNGTAGKPGQGGGGGGASLGTAACVGASGGAGGMGGCGGGPGLGGGGGGASVALLSWASAVSLESCSLSAAAGGAGNSGGAGGLGGTGKVGGSGGAQDMAHIVKTGGNGGKGGSGGNGGNGAGGTGGPSFAVVWGTTAPTFVDTSNLSVSEGGKGGKGGQFGAPADFGFDGKVGKSVAVYPPIPDK